MRSEHRTAGDEFDLLFWRAVLQSRAGVWGDIKRRGRRHDRRVAKPRAIREGVREWREGQP